jgi:hypothetical protein
MHKVYMPECDQIAMKVIMSGFRIHVPHFVESEHIIIPTNIIERVIGYLVPNYGKYLAQLASVSPKKKICGKTFLCDIIPYLVTTFLQCGFFMFDYPDHPITNVFKKIHGYQRLAVPYIKYVHRLKISHKEEKLCQLNDTVADVLFHNLEEIVSLRSTILDYQNHFEQHVNKTAQALFTYDATAHDIGRKQEKLIKAIKDHDSKIGEMKRFMFRLEETNKEDTKNWYNSFLPRE